MANRNMGSISPRLKQIMNDEREMPGVRDLAAQNTTGRNHALKQALNEIAASCSTDEEYLQCLRDVAADTEEDPGLRRAATKRLDLLHKQAQEASLLKNMGDIIQIMLRNDIHY